MARNRARTAPVKQEAAPKPRAEWWIYAVLLLATFAVYSQVSRFDFVNFDDPDYVVNNAHVRGGITSDGIQWAMTSGDAANWFPITRISHMLDAQLFGLRSGWHHLVNVLIHALAVLLLFAFLERATHARWLSAWVALLFALHPLHVESVAWVSERKDVLSAFFWFLALWAYVRYVERPGTRRYLLVLSAFCLGLMAKPMIVTLPFVLLLLDLWPLARPKSAALLWEKAPFFALSAAAAVVTYLVQRGSGAVASGDVFPLGLRIANALVTYVVYILKMLWPSGLAVFYPYPADVPLWQAGAAALALAAVSTIVLLSWRTRPYLAVGWLWYLGTLVPAIGLVQVGAQARADRYMYVPMVGLLIMVAWGAAGLPRKSVPALLAAAACAVLSFRQIGYWRNSETLFRHALDVTEGNYLAHHNLGVALEEDPGRLPEAIGQLQAAIRIKPDYTRAHTDLGNALSKMPDRLPEAVAEYQAALRTDPGAAIPHNDLGNTLARMGRLPDAIREYQAALQIAPDYEEARRNLGVVQAALQRPPDSPEAHYNWGVTLSNEGKTKEAIAEFETALTMRPGYAEADNNLGVVLSQTPSRLPEAIRHFQAALKSEPDNFDAHFNLGVALAGIPGRVPEAIAQLEAALRIKPDPEVRRVLEQLQAERR